MYVKVLLVATFAVSVKNRQKNHILQGTEFGWGFNKIYQESLLEVCGVRNQERYICIPCMTFLYHCTRVFIVLSQSYYNKGWVGCLRSCRVGVGTQARYL